MTIDSLGRTIDVCSGCAPTCIMRPAEMQSRPTMTPRIRMITGDRELHLVEPTPNALLTRP